MQQIDEYLRNLTDKQEEQVCLLTSKEAKRIWVVTNFFGSSALFGAKQEKVVETEFLYGRNRTPS